MSTPSVEELENISSQFTLGFGSFVDKVAYPYASTLQNGSDYLEFHLGNMRFVPLTFGATIMGMYGKEGGPATLRLECD